MPHSSLLLVHALYFKTLRACASQTLSSTCTSTYSFYARIPSTTEFLSKLNTPFVSIILNVYFFLNVNDLNVHSFLNCSPVKCIIPVPFAHGMELQFYEKILFPMAAFSCLRENRNWAKCKSARSSLWIRSKYFSRFFGIKAKNFPIYTSANDSLKFGKISWSACVVSLCLGLVSNKENFCAFNCENVQEKFRNQYEHQMVWIKNEFVNWFLLGKLWNPLQHGLLPRLIIKKIVETRSSRKKNCCHS